MTTPTELSETNGAGEETVENAAERNENTSDVPEEPEVIDLTGISSGSEDEDMDYDDDEGSDSEVEIQLNSETRKQLAHAISTVSATRLRHVLKQLIETEQAVEIALSREFITVQRETQKIVPRWDGCLQCDMEFDVNTPRTNVECVFHPGEMEVDGDGFTDWDEDAHGEKDTQENRIQYPEELRWTCCDKDGTSKGCMQGQHKPMEVTKKRKRTD